LAYVRVHVYLMCLIIQSPLAPETRPMAEAYIVAATRTAGGRRKGKLAGWHPADLAGEVLTTSSTAPAPIRPWSRM